MIDVPMPTWVRWILASAGGCSWWLGMSLAVSGFVSHGGSAPDSEPGGYLVLAFAGVALVVLGWALCLMAFPTFFSIFGGLVAPIAALTAIGLFVSASVLSNVNVLDYDAERAQFDVLVSAMLCLTLTVGLGVNWYIWSNRPGSPVAVQHFLRVAAIGWGASLFINGLYAAVVALVQMAQAGGDSGDARLHLRNAVALAGSGALSVGSGAVLFWHGAAALTGVASWPYRPPAVWKPALALAVAIGLGALLLQTQTAVGLMPLMHAAAVVLPGVSILALVSRAGRRRLPEVRSTWREVLLMVAYGVAVAATIAGIVNILALAFEIVVAAEKINIHAIDDLSNGTVVVVLLIGLSLLVPLDEEFCKGFGVRLLRGHHPTRYQAFLWGLASGVGFGMVEAAEYGFAAFHQSQYRWWDGVLLRGAANSLHGLASGLVGIGWYYMFRGQRRRFFVFYLLAVGLHGSWNALNLLTVARVIPALKRISDQNLEIGLEIGLAVIAAAFLTFLWALARSLAREDDSTLTGLPPSDQTPPASAWEVMPALPG